MFPRAYLPTEQFFMKDQWRNITTLFINWQHIFLEWLITASHFSAFCWQGIGQSHNSMSTVIRVLRIYQNYKCIHQSCSNSMSKNLSRWSNNLLLYSKSLQNSGKKQVLLMILHVCLYIKQSTEGVTCLCSMETEASLGGSNGCKAGTLA